MEKLKINNMSSWRKIDVLTPSSFSADILVISTLWSVESNRGETAYVKTIAMNSLEIDYTKLQFTPLQVHHTQEEAKKYHNNLVKEATQ